MVISCYSYKIMRYCLPEYVVVSYIVNYVPMLVSLVER